MVPRHAHMFNGRESVSWINLCKLCKTTKKKTFNSERDNEIGWECDEQTHPRCEGT